MADTVSNLSINFGANTAGLKAGVGEVQGTLSKLGGGMSSLASAAGPVGIAIAAIGTAAIGTYAAVRSLAEGVGEAMENIDTLAKNADKAGVAMETFQGFAHAADLAGSSTEAMATGLQKLQRNLVEARSGSGAAADALRTLGLDAATISRLPVDEAMLSIADAIAGIEDPAQRTAVAMDLFGKAGADLVPLLSGGSQALQDGIKFIDEYGLAISRVDAAKIEAANDAWTDFSKAMGGVFNELAIALAPASQEVAESMKELAKEMVSLFRESGPLIEEFASRVAMLFGDVLSAVVEVVKFINELIKDLSTVAQWAGVTSGKFDEFKNMPKVANEITESWVKTKAVVDEAAKELEKLMKRGESLTQSLRLPDEIYADTIAELKQLAAAGAITEETFGRAFRKAAEELDKSAMKAQQAFQPLNVGAVTRNSAAGFSAVIDGENAQKKIADIAQKQLEEERRHTRQNEEAIAAFRESTKLNVVTSI